MNAWTRFIFGIHYRHPHAMPELRAAAKAIWEGSGAAFQAEWEKIKPENAPATFDEYLATVDPFTAAKMRVNLIIKNFDNETLVAHMNQMHWGILDPPASAGRFLTSDRPVEMDLGLVSDANIAHFYAYDGNQKRYFGRSRILRVGVGFRLPDDYAVLAEKSVGIVGCVSLGSKLAAVLARAGVRRYGALHWAAKKAQIQQTL